MSWPTPLPLRGVKSKKRAIFQVQKAVLTVDGEPCVIEDVSVSLQSRIFAVGKAGRDVAALLLGKQVPKSAEVLTRHSDLTIAHLTPQEGAETVEDHAAFITEKVAVRPQVVVIDAGFELGGDAWMSAITQVLQSAVSSFQGAVVICCSHEHHPARLHCDTQWMATGSLLKPTLMCDSASPGKQGQQEDLTIAHLTPQERAARPHVVVCDEGIHLGGDAGASACVQTQQSEMDVDDATPKRLASSELVREAVEDVGARAPTMETPSSPPVKLSVENTMVLDHVKVCSEDARPGTYLAGLLEEVSALSLLHFDKDVVDMIRTEQAQNQPPNVLALLVPRSAAQPDEKPENNRLLGFIVYSLWGPPVRKFAVNYLSVAGHAQRLGYGRHMMKWAMSRAKGMPRGLCGSVTVSSLAEAVPFYRQLGFETDKLAEKEPKEEFAIPGQMFMKYKCGRPSVDRKGKARKGGA